jgi:hypothetical protein
MGLPVLTVNALRSADLFDETEKSLQTVGPQTDELDALIVATQVPGANPGWPPEFDFLAGSLACYAACLRLVASGRARKAFPVIAVCSGTFGPELAGAYDQLRKALPNEVATVTVVLGDASSETLDMAVSTVRALVAQVRSLIPRNTTLVIGKDTITRVGWPSRGPVILETRRQAQDLSSGWLNIYRAQVVSSALSDDGPDAATR